MEQVQKFNTFDDTDNVTFRDGKLQICISNTLHELGIPAHIRGYYYLRASIAIAVKQPMITSTIMNGLYPMVAEKFNTTVSRVERAIRTAIEIAWNRGNVEVLNKYFGFTISERRGRPTNSEFIALIADNINLSLSYPGVE